MIRHTQPNALSNYLRTSVAPIVLGAIISTAPITPAYAAYNHPGVLLSQAQLDFIKAQVASNAEPFASAYAAAVASPYGSLTYKLQGPPSSNVIQCGSYSSPDDGCSASDQDGTAAYTQALLWYITGTTIYRDNAIKILNAYANVTYDYNPNDKTTSNGPLQAAWDGDKWARAAEIIRYSSDKWSPAEITAFSNFLTNQIVPLISKGSGNNGNWELSMAEALIGIAVFTDNPTLYAQATALWTRRVPAYIYDFAIDGGAPAPFPVGTPKGTSWNGQTTFSAKSSGVSQETCRDLEHTQFGMASMINAAETDYIQGGTLYTSQRARIEAGLELNTYYLTPPQPVVPSYLCAGGGNELSRSIFYPTFVIAYNEFHNRLGDSLPNTAAYIATESVNLPDKIGAGTNHMISNEVLTHWADASSSSALPPPLPPPPQAGQVTLDAALSDNTNSQTKYDLTFINGGTAPIASVSARVYFDISNVLTAGYNASDIVCQIRSAPPGSTCTLLQYSGSTYYADTTIGVLGAGAKANDNITLNLARYQKVWNTSNDYSIVGLTSTVTATTRIPVYSGTTLLEGTNP